MYDITRFGQSVFQLCSLNEISENGFGNGVYSLHIEKSNLDWLIRGSERNPGFFFVCFSGAITNRNGSPAPFFSGVNVCSELGAPLLAFSDPTLALSGDLPLAWYSGHQNFPNVPDVIAKVIEKYAKTLNATPILFGASGGGFACLVQSKILRVPHYSFVWNAQTSISKYNIDFVYKYLEVAFPDFYHEVASYRDKEAAGDVACELMNRLGIYHSVLDGTSNDMARILYIQNQTDWHVEAHLKPFLRNHKLHSNGMDIFYSANEKIVACKENWGQGHVPPPKEVIISMLKMISSGQTMRACLSKLRILCREVARKSQRASKEIGSDFQSIFWVSDRKATVFSGIPESSKDCNEYFLYAFYLFVNKEKKQVIWYQKERFAEFDISEYLDADIHVEAFLKCADGGGVTRVQSKKIDCYGIADDQGKFIFALGKPLIDLGFTLKFYSDQGEIDVARQEYSPEFSELVRKYKLRDIRHEELVFYKTTQILAGCRSTHVLVHSDVGDFPIDWTHPRLSLDLLATDNEKVFMERFTYASKRHYDSNVVAFTARNNLKDDSIPPNIKINSSIILVYKALERQGWESDAEELLHIIEQAERQIENLKDGFGARKDKVHLATSVIMAKFHILLAFRRYSELVCAARKSIDLLSSSDFKGYYSVNYAKILVIAAFAASRLNDGAHERIFLKCIQDIVPKVDRCIAEEQPGWLYSERKYVDSLAKYASEVLGGVEDFSNDDFKKRVLKEAVRIKEDHYLDKLEIL